MSVKKVQDYLKEYSYLKSIQALLHWDMETMMPSGAIEDRAARLSYIQGKIHAHIIAKKYQSLLTDLEKSKLNSLNKKLLKELKWDFNLNKALPEKHVQEITHAQTIATHAWAVARKNNDWKSFKPHLEKLVTLKKRETGFYSEKKPYDALIKLHDKEFNSEEITKIFSELKSGLIPLTKKIKAAKTFVAVKDLKGPFDIEAQKKLSEFVAKVYCLPEAFSRLDVSTHPFSINISPQDQRITTRYSPDNLDSLGSTMHEVGHALYEHNLPREWEGTPFQEAVSLSVHESQSRFWENIVGRSQEFCEFLHPNMKKYFPEAMKGISPEKLFHIFNKSVPGVIRVESSELYYNLHVIIRFEIEEMIFNQDLSVKELPEIWNQKYKDYLGVTPKNFSEGILQDSHWAGAAFGYFPTYTIGNLISGSLYQKINKDMKSFRKDLKRGELQGINLYLKKSIHDKGRSISSKDIVGSLKVNDYLSYLSEKFGV